MTMTMTTQNDTVTIYISPYEIRKPRGRPRIPDELKKKLNQVPKAPAGRVGRPRREVPLSPEEIIERRLRYKNNNATELKQEYERFYQRCYFQRPEVKAHKAEYKRNKRSAEREARNS